MKIKLIPKFCQHVIVLSLLASLIACGNVKDDLPEQKQSKLELYLTAVEAYNLLKKNDKNTMFDVRTRGEFKQGKPSLAEANIPIFFKDKDTGGLTPNQNFVSDIEESFDKNGLTLNESMPIVLICRQGNRSARAVDVLAKKGYKKVYTVTDGTLGWQKNNLPWSN